MILSTHRKLAYLGASCIENNLNSPVDPTKVYVRLGAYDLYDEDEKASKKSVHNVLKIRIHKDWNSSHKTYDADLALLTLDKLVQFTKYIQQSCVVASSMIDEISDGTVVSRRIDKNEEIMAILLKVFWGESGDNETTKFIPQKLSTVTVNDDRCTKNISASRTFCTRSDSSQAFTNGTGFYFLLKSLYRDHPSIRKRSQTKKITALVLEKEFIGILFTLRGVS